MNDDEIIGICDRCSCAVPEEEAYTGEEGTEWAGCNLCAVCDSEVGPAAQAQGGA